MILQSKYIQDENGVKFAPISTPNAIRWPNGSNLNDKLKQADWNESDSSDPAFIKNKPNITNGLDGSDGKSAYELAVENGYSGTVQEWLASLHGLDGTNGTNGTNGVTPHIDSTSKHWMIGTTDTGVVAEGQDGTNPTGAVTSSTSGLKIEVVSSLPGSPDANTIYIVQ